MAFSTSQMPKFFFADAAADGNRKEVFLTVAKSEFLKYIICN